MKSKTLIPNKYSFSDKDKGHLMFIKYNKWSSRNNFSKS